MSATPWMWANADGPAFSLMRSVRDTPVGWLREPAEEACGDERTSLYDHAMRLPHRWIAILPVVMFAFTHALACDPSDPAPPTVPISDAQIATDSSSVDGGDASSLPPGSGCSSHEGEQCNDDSECCAPVFRCNTLTTYKCTYACYPGGVTCSSSAVPCCAKDHVCTHNLLCELCIPNGGISNYPADCCSQHANPDTGKCEAP